MTAHSTIAAVLFDLDGTLLDTAGDLLAALNHALASINQPAQNFAQTRPYASHGAKGLLEYALGERLVDFDFPTLRATLLEYYAREICVHTQFFPDMESTLDALQQRQIKWGVVTNKPASLTDALLPHFTRFNDSGINVSGDTLPVSKPDPAPLLWAAQQLNVTPQQCLYVGDASRDIEAGNAAGMCSLVAAWGYLHEHDHPELWQASGILASPENLLDWL